MPTHEEWTELRAQCAWTWTTLNDVKGYIVENRNGNSIFLPAAGRRYGADLNDAGSSGYCWSSSLYLAKPFDAWDVYFGSDGVNKCDSRRDYGRSVRPVTE